MSEPRPDQPAAWPLRVLLRRLRWRLGLIPSSGHPSISNEPLTIRQTKRANLRSKREGWKGIVP